MYIFVTYISTITTYYLYNLTYIILLAIIVTDILLFSSAEEYVQYEKFQEMQKSGMLDKLLKLEKQTQAQAATPRRRPM